MPPWFAEVVLMAQDLNHHGVLEALTHQVRLVRGRFGEYEAIDFLALLFDYAISGERILQAFFTRLAPFARPFMAWFGRSHLPHRSSLSRFLAAVDRPCLEAVRTQFEKTFGQGWSSETIGGLWDRQGQRYVVFDGDAPRQPARQRALPAGEELPAARGRLDQVCAPGYLGRKRGEVVRTRTAVLQMHSRQWVGTYSGAGNGDYREELRSACRAIHSYLDAYQLPPATGLVRRDGQYGDAAVIAQVGETGLPVVVRGRGYHLLTHPQIQHVLAQPPVSVGTHADSGVVYDLFDGGWLWLDDALPRCRVIVARRAAPPPPQTVTVGKRVGDMVYQGNRILFLDAQNCEERLIAPSSFEPLGFHTHLGSALLSQEIESKMTQERQIVVSMPDTDTGSIFSKGDIEDPMHAIFNAPVARVPLVQRLAPFAQS